MLRSPTRIAVPVVVGALLALTGCTTHETAPLPASGFCDRTTAERLVGQARLTDAEAIRLTGASIVRQIAPGKEVQQDYTDARVTIETDPTTGRIVRAFCG